MQGIDTALKRAARRAAEPVSPGMSIKAQINAACDNLGYPRGHWRVREAWYGTARNWQVGPAIDFLRRYDRLERKRTGQSSPYGDALIQLFAGSFPSE